MKYFITLLTLCLLTSCQENEDTMSLLYGKWRLVETSPTSSLTIWIDIPVDSVFIIEFTDLNYFKFTNSSDSFNFSYTSEDQFIQFEDHPFPYPNGAVIKNITKEELILTNMRISSYCCYSDKYIRMK
jgi:hypothetical protein